jgi:CheY-like chemotaxis protein
MSKIILCADDSVTMQKVAEITFRGTDYTFVGARSADEAIDKAKAQKPSLVLADAVMPGKTGYDLCQALKSDDATADVPVVILCGNSAPFDTARGTAVGADGSFTKPWDTQVLLDKVVEFLEKAATSGVAKATAGGAIAAAARPVSPQGTLVGAPAPAIPAPMSPAAAAAAAAAKPQQPPRSATIMGMPTIKMPPGPGGIATAVPLTATIPAPAPVVSVPAPIAVPVPVVAPVVAPVSPKQAPIAAAPIAAPIAAAPVAAAPIAKPAPARAMTPTPAPYAAAAMAASSAAPARAPMIAATPTKRSELVERTLAKMAARLSEATGLAAGSPELLALLKLSTEVVERIVWEVVPELAESIIREHLHELAAKRN